MSTASIEQYKERAAIALEIVHEKYDYYMQDELFEQQCEYLWRLVVDRAHDVVLADDILDWQRRARRAVLHAAKECSKIQECTDIREAAGRTNTMDIHLRTALLDLSIARLYHPDPTVP